ncbi:hypothetical protein WMY93_013096 [Mugilogobius chulae]|uniref:Uncharacterized protein n=1 Tax=Mugilogobius chulae TaxID=88201 RepID=A0AAW0P892_9GOBI
MEPEPHHAHVSGRTMHLHRLRRAVSDHTAQTRSMDFLKHLRLLRPIQEFGLARFKSNQGKAMKGLEYALSNLQGETPQRLLRGSMKDASGKAKEAAKTLATAASPQQNPSNTSDHTPRKSTRLHTATGLNWVSWMNTAAAAAVFPFMLCLNLRTGAFLYEIFCL